MVEKGCTTTWGSFTILIEGLAEEALEVLNELSSIGFAKIQSAEQVVFLRYSSYTDIEVDSVAWKYYSNVRLDNQNILEIEYFFILKPNQKFREENNKQIVNEEHSAYFRDRYEAHGCSHIDPSSDHLSQLQQNICMLTDNIEEAVEHHRSGIRRALALPEPEYYLRGTSGDNIGSTPAGIIGSTSGGLSKLMSNPLTETTPSAREQIERHLGPSDAHKCPELAKRYSDKVSKTVDETMTRLDDFVRSEEAFASTELPRGEASEAFRKSAGPINRREDWFHKGGYKANRRRNEGTGTFNDMDGLVPYHT
nr:pentatricopeptide repeat-containing protein At1g09900 [Tanacetum cinerariifolium]